MNLVSWFILMWAVGDLFGIARAYSKKLYFLLWLGITILLIISYVIVETKNGLEEFDWVKYAVGGVGFLVGLYTGEAMYKLWKDG